jgi:hypothetical protein
LLWKLLLTGSLGETLNERSVTAKVTNRVNLVEEVVGTWGVSSEFETAGGANLVSFASSLDWNETTEPRWIEDFENIN